MKRAFPFAPLLGAMLTLTTACNKADEPTPTPTPTPTPVLTLPLSVDFKTIPSANGKSSFEASGITFTGAGANYPSDFDTAQRLKTCIAANSTSIRHGSSGVMLASSTFNTLIADVSKMPAIQKITVKMFDNSRPSTHLALCDGNDNIMHSATYTGSNPEVTYTLNVGGKTAKTFYVFSLEAGVHSVTFE